MNTDSFQALREILIDGLRKQRSAVQDWHAQNITPETEFQTIAEDHSLADLIAAEHWSNMRLWHVEDRARRRDVGAEEIMRCKQAIDALNQKRNNLIEEIDIALIRIMTPLLPAGAPERYNTETVGSAVDRMSILALKIHHMEEQVQRTDVDDTHTRECRQKCQVMETQHRDLEQSILELLEDYEAGRKRPKVYYQFKMYNRPELNPELYGANQS